MTDKLTLQDRLQGKGQAAGHAGSLSKKKDTDADEVEASCGAFGYLRGIREKSSAVEFRFRTRPSIWFPYAWLGTWQHDPSEGLLLKFVGDVTYLVLIRGSNLDLPLNEGSINLTSGGLQRHRVVWIREMTEEDVKAVGDTAPTIDSIEVAEFESHAELKDWLSRKAPTFVQ